jgi:hypothetical protein
MFDSWIPPPRVDERSAEDAARRADVVFGWVFDVGIVLLSLLALLMP